MQAGDITVNVKWSKEAESYCYSCIFGCWEADFESRWEAEQKFLAHQCVGAQHEVPC